LYFLERASHYLGFLCVLCASEVNALPKGVEMKKPIKMISVFCIGIAFLMASILPVFAQAKIVRAKVGILIKSGDQTMRAKGKDRLKAGDFLRIYVQPEENFYVYVVHTDQKDVKLISSVDRQPAGSQVVLPARQDFYEVDGESPVETFTIICSPDELKEVSTLLNSQISYEKWAALEKELIKKGEIDLGQKAEKPFPIAGNVRGAIDPNDRFAADLQIYSGNTILVKQYEFSVKK
jgi:hypothetical protein